MSHGDIVFKQEVVAVDEVLGGAFCSAEVCDMETGAVLDVATVAERDACDIAAQDGVEPYGTFVAERDVAD